MRSWALSLIWSLYATIMLFCVDSLNDYLVFMNNMSEAMIGPLYAINVILSHWFSRDIWAYVDKLLFVTH
jgi:hypothetical protein